MEEISEYWKKYEEFNQSFKETGRFEISDSLENARNYVNGLTDGWYEFLNNLKKTQKYFIKELSKKETQRLNSIIQELEKNLKRK